jgi:hypothetical protein
MKTCGGLPHCVHGDVDEISARELGIESKIPKRLSVEEKLSDSPFTVISQRFLV